MPQARTSASTSSAPSSSSLGHRVLEGDEKLIWIPALRSLYQEQSGFGLGGQTAMAWDAGIWHGRLVLVERGGVSIGAVFFTDLAAGDGATVHVLRWDDPGPRADWIAALTALLRAALLDLDLRRVEAYIPACSIGAIDLAEEIGMEDVGRIPDGMRLPDGAFVDLHIYLIHRERWHGTE